MVGLEDALVNEQVDPITGESLGCWKTINTDKQSELPDAEEILYSLTSQGINSDIIVNFIDMVESEKLQLLEKRADDSYDKKTLEETRKSVVPYLETDFLLEEIANLKLVTRNNGKFKVDRQTTGIDDDRYHALAYVLWYIQMFESDYDSISMNAEPLSALFIN